MSRRAIDCRLLEDCGLHWMRYIRLLDITHNHVRCYIKDTLEHMYLWYSERSSIWNTPMKSKAESCQSSTCHLGWMVYWQIIYTFIHCELKLFQGSATGGPPILGEIFVFHRSFVKKNAHFCIFAKNAKFIIFCDKN